MRTLLKTTDLYLVDTEEEAMKMIEEAKDNQITGGYTVTKSGYTMKTKKAKGEIVDVSFKVSIERTFNE
jgi:hypothetical protein